MQEAEKFIESVRSPDWLTTGREMYNAIIRIAEFAKRKGVTVNFTILSPTSEETRAFASQILDVKPYYDDTAQEITGIIIFATHEDITEETKYVLGLTNNGQIVVFCRETSMESSVDYLKTAISPQTRNRGLFHGLGAALQAAYPYNESLIDHGLTQVTYQAISKKGAKQLIEEHIKPIKEQLS